MAARSGDELRWLSRITWSAVLYLAGAILDGVSGAVILSSLSGAGVGPFPGASIGRSGPTASQVQGMVQAFQYMTTLLPLTLLAIIAAMILLWTGFRGLSKGGAGEFSLPSRLTLLAVLGLAILVPAMLVLFSSIVPLMSSLSQQGRIGAAGGLDLIFAGSGLALGGAVLVMIGYIGGVMLGLWRVGSRYGQSVLKVAAIMTIIPFLSVVAPILVLIGVSRAERAARQALSAGI